MGLMQLMPSTAALYRVTDAFDPAQNIRAGVAYLKSLLTRFNDNQSLALAAYNAGPGAVEKYGNVVPPYKETRNYVARITRQHADHDRRARPRLPHRADRQRPDRRPLHEQAGRRRRGRRRDQPPVTPSVATTSDQPTNLGIAASYAISVTDVCLNAAPTRTTSCR